jgi:phenylacetate-CoA ligase
MTVGIETRLAEFGNWQKACRLLVRDAARSPFVRRQLERSGMTAEQAAASAEAWAMLSPVTKDDLLEDQRRAPPFGTRLSAPIEDLAIIVESSGTTAMGKEAHCISRADYAATLEGWGASLRRMGITPRDIVAMTFPVGMSGGGVKHADAYAHVGAKVLRIANLSTRAKLDAMAYYGTTVLVATPFYVDRLAAVAAEADIDVRSLRMRKVVVATQSVTCDWVRATERRWGAKLYEWYGTAAGLIAFSCEHGMMNDRGERGTLHWDPELALYEVLDGEGALVTAGRRGELIGTPFVSSAEPLFRFRTRDEVGFQAPGTCRCGSHWPGIESGTVRRLDGMFKVKGVNVWPSHVEAVLFAAAAGIRDYRVRICLDERGRESMRMDLLLPPEDASPASLRDSLIERLRSETGLGFDVALSHDSSQWLLATTGEAAKPRRWVDERTA